MCPSLLLLLLIIVIYLVFGDKKEKFETGASLEAQTEMCTRFYGVVEEVNGQKLCRLPKTIQNDSILNWQLAGRYCDLEYLYQTQGCKTPGRIENPYAQNANRGNFHYNA